MKSKFHSASGNMLLIVLIGIALFAALMFVITRENRYDTGVSEKAALDAQQITTYADKVNGAVQNLMVQNHCLATQISFTNGASGKCAIFDSTGIGGGMIVQSPPAEAVDTTSATTASWTLPDSYVFEGNVCVEGIGTGPAPANGSACSATTAELVFIMPFVTQAVCAQINQITMNSTTIPTIATTTFDGTTFTGTFAGTYTISTGVGTDSAHTNGLSFASGCYYQSTATHPGIGYHFYEVLATN
jgi:hypothetical protein